MLMRIIMMKFVWHVHNSFKNAYVYRLNNQVLQGFVKLVGELVYRPLENKYVCSSLMINRNIGVVIFSSEPTQILLYSNHTRVCINMSSHFLTFYFTLHFIENFVMNYHTIYF